MECNYKFAQNGPPQDAWPPLKPWTNIRSDCTDTNVIMMTGPGERTWFPSFKNGEEACEGHGFNEDQCLDVDCCHWADASCWSSIGTDLCSNQVWEHAHAMNFQRADSLWCLWVVLVTRDY